ncbi:MAG: prepilin-type N-terminal cleavage/methylation domain-containing protein [Paenibacillaceae bacterium]|nr:prepilin-type N-terminal cleavage/methylation domain-containing protein [Paenibacillaceae bacterium]
MRIMRNERGVTLIEALAAVVILGIVVSAFAAISNYTFLAGNHSDKQTNVQSLAKEQLDYAREYALQHGDKPSDASLEGYTITFQLTDLASPASYNQSYFQMNHYSLQGMVLINKTPKLLTVTVSWEGAP